LNGTQVGSIHENVFRFAVPALESLPEQPGATDTGADSSAVWDLMRLWPTTWVANLPSAGLHFCLQIAQYLAWWP